MRDCSDDLETESPVEKVSPQVGRFSPSFSGATLCVGCGVSRRQRGLGTPRLCSCFYRRCDFGRANVDSPAPEGPPWLVASRPPHCVVWNSRTHWTDVTRPDRLEWRVEGRVLRGGTPGSPGRGVRRTDPWVRRRWTSRPRGRETSPRRKVRGGLGASDKERRPARTTDNEEEWETGRTQSLYFVIFS